MSKSDTKQPAKPPTTKAAFGQRLRTPRLAQGYSLADLAQILEVTKGYVSKLEAGKTRPSEKMVQRIAQTLHMDANALSVAAGYLPTDVNQILYQYPVEAPALLRETFSDYATEGKSVIQEASKLVVDSTTLRPEVLAPRLETLYEVYQADCFDWMAQHAMNSIHAVVTDPPYGLKEYTAEEKSKLRRGHGGVWRIPPTLDGYTRRPLPRFTVLTHEDKESLRDFFSRWGTAVLRVLVPGGHVFIATNPLLSHVVYMALIEAGFEKRGEIIRLVQTLRGGDRPKNAYKEFDSVTVMPRSGWEPWGLFRKPCEGRVQDNLRKWKTGGLRRVSQDQPFCDVIRSAPTHTGERDIAPHPSLKPQAFMRQIVRAALPLGEGIVLDPFMGGGSTIAAACALRYRSIGIESDPEFFAMAVQAIPRLAAYIPNGESNGTGTPMRREDPHRQQTLF